MLGLLKIVWYFFFVCFFVLNMFLRCEGRIFLIIRIIFLVFICGIMNRNVIEIELLNVFMIFKILFLLLVIFFKVFLLRLIFFLVFCKMLSIFEYVEFVLNMSWGMRRYLKL